MNHLLIFIYLKKNLLFIWFKNKSPVIHRAFVDEWVVSQNHPVDQRATWCPEMFLFNTGININTI